MNEKFRMALEDYLYLTKKGYAPKGFLELVGNRYELSNTERTILYRGIARSTDIQFRKTKLTENPGGKPIFFIDGLNVITTMSSYLLGLPVFIAMDGLLRDASRKRGKLEENARMIEAVGLIQKYLLTLNPARIIYFLDKTGTATEQAKKAIQQNSAKFRQPVQIEIPDQVDKKLIEIEHGIICSSDSGIIDLCRADVFDLARHVLHHFYSPDIPDLREWSNQTYKI